MQTVIQQRGLQDRVSLLSISFDPEHDTPKALKAYAKRMQVDETIWCISSSASKHDGDIALSAFDVMVIPDPQLLYLHNAAIHLVNLEAKLARIIDYDDPASPLDVALALPTMLVPKASIAMSGK
jgi:protein SCO1